VVLAGRLLPAEGPAAGSAWPAAIQDDHLVLGEWVGGGLVLVLSGLSMDGPADR
jgi:hypothetical protein